MKSNLSIWLLLIAAVAVWGLVAYKFLILPSKVPNPIRIPRPSDTVVSVTDTLLLNYRDPFGSGTEPVSGQPAVRKELRIPAVAVSPAREKSLSAWGYSGKIVRAETCFYLLDVDGIQHALRIGDTLRGFTLRTAFADSVRLTDAAGVYTIRLK